MDSNNGLTNLQRAVNLLFSATPDQLAAVLKIFDPAPQNNIRAKRSHAWEEWSNAKFQQPPSTRLINCLWRAGIGPAEAFNMSDRELLWRVRMFGPRLLAELRGLKIEDVA